MSSCIQNIESFSSSSSSVDNLGGPKTVTTALVQFRSSIFYLKNQIERLEHSNWFYCSKKVTSICSKGALVALPFSIVLDIFLDCLKIVAYFFLQLVFAFTLLGYTIKDWLGDRGFFEKGAIRDLKDEIAKLSRYFESMEDNSSDFEIQSGQKILKQYEKLEQMYEPFPSLFTFIEENSSPGFKNLIEDCLKSSYLARFSDKVASSLQDNKKTPFDLATIFLRILDGQKRLFSSSAGLPEIVTFYLNEKILPQAILNTDSARGKIATLQSIR